MVAEFMGIVSIVQGEFCHSPNGVSASCRTSTTPAVLRNKARQFAQRFSRMQKQGAQHTGARLVKKIVGDRCHVLNFASLVAIKRTIKHPASRNSAGVRTMRPRWCRLCSDPAVLAALRHRQTGRACPFVQYLCLLMKYEHETNTSPSSLSQGRCKTAIYPFKFFSSQRIYCQYSYVIYSKLVAEHRFEFACYAFGAGL